MKDNRNLDFKILEALSVEYPSVYYVDLDKDTFILYRLEGDLNTEARGLAKSTNCLTQTLLDIIDIVVVDEQKEYMKRETDRKKVKKRLEAEGSFVLRYRAEPNLSGREFFEMLFVKVGDEGNAVIAFRCVDDLARQLETTMAERDLAKEELARNRVETERTLSNLSTGLWTMERREGKEPKMYMDSTIRMLLGQGFLADEEDTYQEWLGRIHNEDRKNVITSLRSMSRENFSESTYRWKHPLKGWIWLRAGGAQVESTEKDVLQYRGYVVNITESIEKEEASKKKLQSAYDSVNEKNKELQEQMQIVGGLMKSFVAIYYVDRFDGSFEEIGASDSIRELFDSKGDIQKSFLNWCYFAVKEHSRDSYIEFVNLFTLMKRIGDKEFIACEYEDSVVGWSRALWIPTDYEKGIPKHFLFAVQDIDEEKRMKNHLLEISEIDGMTKIRNRTSGQKQVSELLKERTAGLFCIMDCDHFKLINDTHGHAVGDQVLIEIANCLKQSFRDVDVTMRLGGDEFGFYITGKNTRLIYKKSVERFFSKIKKISIEQLQDINVCVSVGAVEYDGSYKTSFDELYTAADRAMYLSKKHEGNYLTFSDKEPTEASE
ncbi:MAG: sensor domain-containing diguanylate cyclase [Lachnospiraceae bacterium]|nr:sensor domain-containing diguanylate cyclase [Lachnospiraceae bacterium]